MKNIRPIKTQDDYEWALVEIEKYFNNQPQLGTPEADRFDVLSILIEAYEADHFPIPAPTPIETIVAYMQMHGLKPSDLGAVIGSRPRASEILNYRRTLTREMAYKIHKEWQIPAEILLQPYHLKNEMRAA